MNTQMEEKKSKIDTYGDWLTIDGGCKLADLNYKTKTMRMAIGVVSRTDLRRARKWLKVLESENVFKLWDNKSWVSLEE